jgi:predicted ATP-dependent serine protease
VRLVKDSSVAGPASVEYEFDCSLHLIVKEDLTSRELTIPSKNRFGPIGRWPLELTDLGWRDLATREANPEILPGY